jgi:hypothetical protein
MHGADLLNPCKAIVSTETGGNDVHAFEICGGIFDNHRRTMG